MLYDIGFAIFSLFYLPTLIFKGKLHRDFLERFGAYGAAKQKQLAACNNAIWIQAVSVGEVVLCKTLIPLLKEEFPASPIVLSTITRTGNDLAKKLYANEAIIIYFPLDFSFVVKKVMGLIRPRIYVMIETEIWPNMLKEAACRSVPSILINGRISDRSFGKYKLARPFLQTTLRTISKFCMQSDADAERIVSLGALRDRVVITGNMKFDIRPLHDPAKAEEMKRLLGLAAGDKLFVAGSTHRGEEEIAVRIFKELSREFRGLKLLIAPRHVERTREIEVLIKKIGFEPIRFSYLPANRQTGKPANTIFILDTIGQLKDAYAVATLVFIGGSLVKYGGQNPIEPAIFEKPILFGPHMFNFKNITAKFLEDRAAVQVADEKELLERSRFLLIDASKRSALGKNARRMVSENRGATERNLEAIVKLIK